LINNWTKYDKGDSKDMIQITDVERAVALLTLEHKVMSPTLARRLIDKSRAQKLPLEQLFMEAVQESVALKAIAKSIGTKYVDLYATQMEYDFSPELVKMLRWIFYLASQRSQ